MKTFFTCGVAVLLFITLSSQTVETQNDGWINLFDGKSLDGWKASEHPATFSVADGSIVVYGDRAHLFYEGPVSD
jgi:hypothetical protein